MHHHCKNRYDMQSLSIIYYLQIRDDLIRGDSSSTMALLMRYPQQKDVTAIVDMADMIRRYKLVVSTLDVSHLLLP